MQYRVSHLVISAGLTAAGAVLVLNPGVWQGEWLGMYRQMATAAAGILLVLGGAWASSNAVDWLLWRNLEKKWGTAPPGPLVVLGRLLIVLGAGLLIAGVVFEQALTGLLVSSGAVGVVLGFALQHMISDFFSGIALNVERPFGVGDWVEVEGVCGRVVEMNWRATRLVTLDDVMVVIPNSTIAHRLFRNYNRPNASFRCEVPVFLEYSVPVPEARRVLTAAVRQTPGVLDKPVPDVLARGFGPHGMEYAVRFFVTDYQQLNVVRDRVLASISRHLWQAGYSIPYPKRDVYQAPMPPRQVDRNAEPHILLARLDLFDGLAESELRSLGTSVREHRCRPDDFVVRQGQAGDSMFVVVDGLLEVRLEEAEAGRCRVLAQLGAGDAFGEMSLLTGAPRSASVVAVTEATLFELSGDRMRELLQRRPALAEQLSSLLAERQIKNEKSAALLEEEIERRKKNRSEELLGRIRAFFRLH